MYWAGNRKPYTGSLASWSDLPPYGSNWVIKSQILSFRFFSNLLLLLELLNVLGGHRSYRESRKMFRFAT